MGRKNKPFVVERLHSGEEVARDPEGKFNVVEENLTIEED